MTKEQRDQLKKFKRNMRTIATMMSNSLIGFQAMATGEKDPQTRAAYTMMVRMTPALVAECRSLALEVEKDLHSGHLRDGDAWQSLLNRSRLVSYKCQALQDEFQIRSGDGANN
jgi:hypothetical protein